MCFSIYLRSNVRKLCFAARQVQKLIDDGILPEAFNRNRNGEAHTAVVAFDTLAKVTALVTDEQKEVSPFLRYRMEMMGDNAMAALLRDLVINLWGSRESNIGTLLFNADQHHTRITLECIASYAHLGENDPHFMALVTDIREREESTVAS